MNAPQPEWRPVVGKEGMYEVSNLGSVRSIRSEAHKNLSGRVLRDFRPNGRYPMVHLGFGNSTAVHVLVAAAWIGPRPHGYEINHIDGDVANNACSNLAYVTPEQNRLHARQVLRRCCGESHWRSRLTAQQVREIRAMRGSISQADIGSKYGVTQSTINDIHVGRTWRLA